MSYLRQDIEFVEFYYVLFVSTWFDREHSDMPYICSQCGDGFQTPKEYSEHSVTVHRAHFKNQCALCDKK